MTATPKNLLPACLWGMLTATGWHNASVQAQEALRESLAAEAAAERRKAEFEAVDYNLRFGSVRILLEGAFSAEFNDNINYSATDPRADLLLRPLLNTAAFWPVTDKNILNFSLGLGYEKYINHAEYDRALIVPGSELTFDFFVKRLRITFYDRFFYMRESLNRGAVSGAAEYGGLDNLAGVKVTWDLHKAVLDTYYGHQNWVSSTERFDYLDRSSELVLGRVSFLLNPALTVGTEWTASWTAYDREILNDSLGHSAGAFAQWRIAQHLRLTPRAGYVTYIFDKDSVAGRENDPRTWYSSLNFSRRAGKFLTHSLEVGRQLCLGITSNYEELYYARYNLDWIVNRRTRVGTGLFYEIGEYPRWSLRGPGGPPFFSSGEEYDRFGVTLGFSYALSKTLKAHATYRHVVKKSTWDARDYDQNVLILGGAYHF